MQRDAVARGDHSVLADAPVDIAAGEVIGRDFLLARELGVVGRGEVGRAGDKLGHGGPDHIERRLARLAGGDLRLFIGKLLLVGVDHLIEVWRQIAAQPPLEFGAHLRVERLDRVVPRFALRRAARSRLAPGAENVVGDDERLVGPVQGLAGAGDLGRPLRVTVRLLGSRVGWQAEADRRLAGDHRRLVGILRRMDGVEDRLRIVPVDVGRIPARRLEAGDLVDVVGEDRDLPVDRDPVVVPENNQLVELEMAGDADRFVAHAFHQVAVGSDDIGVVIDDAWKARGHHALCDRHADRGRNPLPERAGRRLDARSAPIFGVPGRPRADLAELLDVFDAQSFGAADAGQIEQAVEQHAAVAAREDEPVAIGPMGIGRVEFEHVAPENRGDVGHPHRQAGVAALGLLDRIEGEKADRIGHRVVRHARRTSGHGRCRHRGSPQEMGAGNSEFRARAVI